MECASWAAWRREYEHPADSAEPGIIRRMLLGVADQFGSTEAAGGTVNSSPEPAFCISVGGIFDKAADESANPEVAHSYQTFKVETAAQFEAMVAAGLTVRPWVHSGQPYHSSHELRERVAATGELFVYLTRNGHGSLVRPAAAHPLRESSEVVIDGESFLYNDLFRAVHDAFGHVLYENSFSLQGELRASLVHMGMYSELAAKAVFTETVGQICWFYCGPHLLIGDGSRCRRSGEAGYIPPESRPYADQRVFLFPDRLVREFLSSFDCGHLLHT